MTYRILAPSSSINGIVSAPGVDIGCGVVVEAGAELRAKTRIRIGDFTFIGRGVHCDLETLSIGEYTKIHAHTFLSGPNTLSIGHNCWVGEHTILDTMGGLWIADNVGIGAHSQVWGHMQHGDIVEGCRFYSKRPVRIERDAWLVGHCIVSTGIIAERSMALAGAVVTHDTVPNHVYAGVPAVDVTDKLGPQFERGRPSDHKRLNLRDCIHQFEAQHPEFSDWLTVLDPSEVPHDDHRTYFDVDERTYTKKLSAAEVAFRQEFPLIRVVPA